MKIFDERRGCPVSAGGPVRCPPVGLSGVRRRACPVSAGAPVMYLNLKQDLQRSNTVDSDVAKGALSGSRASLLQSGTE